MTNLPKYRSPTYELPNGSKVKGKEYTCILWGVHPQTGWEWYGFEIVSQSGTDVVYFGLVHGFETELGYFALSELKASRVAVYNNPRALNDIAPPVGWERIKENPND